MKKTLLFVLILSGLSALSTNMVREYHYVKKLKTWTEAQTYCRERFHDLATVKNQEEEKRLRHVLKGRGKYAWIGLYDGLKEWRWLPGNVKLNTNDFSNWAENTDNEESNKNCVLMTKQGLWYNYSCRRKRPAVCYYGQGPSKYILVKSERSVHQARKYCRSNYTDLVRVSSESENKNISSLLSEDSWIGLFRRLWDTWSDQTIRSFANWNEGEPDNPGVNMTTCAAVNTTTGKWWDVRCNAKHHFICQNGSDHKTTLKFKFQSEAGLSNPAVQQQILEQLHAKLEEHGLPDFKLRWIQTDGHTFHKEQKGKKDKGSGG